MNTCPIALTPSIQCTSREGAGIAPLKTSQDGRHLLQHANQDTGGVTQMRTWSWMPPMLHMQPT